MKASDTITSTPTIKMGCCRDESCSSTTCMVLPAGTTCGSCKHYTRCAAMFGAKVDGPTCDFFPRRYAARQEIVA